MPPDGTTADLPDITIHLEPLRKTVASGRSRDLSWRRRQLEALRRLMIERETEFAQALHQDMRKPHFEAYITEIAFVRAETEHALANLACWTRPESVKTPITNQLGSSRVLREPLGLVLIIGPWNYPLQLVLSPLIGALAAGNCAVLKPSELSPHTARALAEWIPRYLDSDGVRVVEGGIPETTALLTERFDHIFFTGGETVARVVMQAAAKHLTPVTLELGGKSPAIVDESADLRTAARRIIWGKFLNAGQTCVAPDYTLVQSNVAPAFTRALQDVLKEFYGGDPRRSPDYARIATPRHFHRLLPFLQDGEILCGGEHDEASLYIAPTLLKNVSPTSGIMGEEIFGPILPILTYKTLDEAIAFIRARPKPLALYIFSASSASQERVLSETSSGGACINDCVAHLGVPELPFGGVGASGTGAYHGRWSFETFSHRKAVLQKSTLLDPSLRYPPYSDAKMRWARRLM